MADDFIGVAAAGGTVHRTGTGDHFGAAVLHGAGGVGLQYVEHPAGDGGDAGDGAEPFLCVVLGGVEPEPGLVADIVGDPDRRVCAIELRHAGLQLEPLFGVFPRVERDVYDHDIFEAEVGRAGGQAGGGPGAGDVYQQSAADDCPGVAEVSGAQYFSR